MWVNPLDAQVDFRDDAEEVEADGDDGGPKRAVHGRKATAFVKKGKAVGARNLSPTADDDWWSLCDYVLEVVYAPVMPVVKGDDTKHNKT